MAFGTIVQDIHRILDEVSGAAARDAKAALGHLEAEAAKVHGAVTGLIAKAKADIEAAVAEAEPVVKEEAGKVVAQLEADAEAALAALLTHAV